jgi:hypothetical protein
MITGKHCRSLTFYAIAGDKITDEGAAGVFTGTWEGIIKITIFLRNNFKINLLTLAGKADK